MSTPPPGPWPRGVLGPLLLALAFASVPLAGCRRVESKTEAARPQLGAIGTFTLTDQLGRAFSPAELRGKPWLAAFMFTRCPTICPRITALMKEVQGAAQKQGLSLHMVSFSVDPEYDTPVVLRAYAQTHGLGGAWTLLTGDVSTVAETAERQFKIGVSGSVNPEAEHLGLTHGSHLVLVDGAGQIRGYFPSSDDGSVQAILNAVAELE